MSTFSNNNFIQFLQTGKVISKAAAKNITRGVDDIPAGTKGGRDLEVSGKGNPRGKGSSTEWRGSDLTPPGPNQGRTKTQTQTQTQTQTKTQTQGKTPTQTKTQGKTQTQGKGKTPTPNQGKGSKGTSSKTTHTVNDPEPKQPTYHAPEIEERIVVGHAEESPITSQEMDARVENNLGVNQPVTPPEIEAVIESNPFARGPQVKTIFVNKVPIFIVETKADLGDGVHEMLPWMAIYNDKHGWKDAVSGRYLSYEDGYYGLGKDGYHNLVNAYNRLSRSNQRRSIGSNIDLQNDKTRKTFTEQLGQQYFGDRSLSKEQMTQLLIDGGDPKALAKLNRERAANQTIQDTPNTNTAEEKTSNWKKHAKNAALWIPSIFVGGTTLWNMFAPKQSYSPEGENTSDTDVVIPESDTDSMHYAPAIIPASKPDITPYGETAHPLNIAKIMRDDLRIPDTLYYNNPKDSIYMIRRSNNIYDHYRWNDEGHRIIDEFNFE